MIKIGIAAAVLLGLASTVLQASERGNAAHRQTAYAESRGARPINRARTNRSNAIATPGENLNRPAYAPPNECWTDDGGYRWRPCDAASGGGGGM